MEQITRRTAALVSTQPRTALEIVLDHAGTTVTVALRGDIDASSCGLLRDELLSLVGSGLHDVVVVDCAGVAYCGMLGQAVLRRAHHEAAAAGRRFVLRNVGPRMERVARMSGLDEVLDVGR